VPPFEADFLPPIIRPWVLDIANRMQVPTEYVAIPAMTALGSVLGRKIALHPKQLDSWAVIANLWGMVIGPPGLLKSPPMEEVLKPVRKLEVEAGKAFAVAMEFYEAALEQWEDDKKAAKQSDITPAWENTDTAPDRDASEAAWKAFEWLDRLDLPRLARCLRRGTIPRSCGSRPRRARHLSSGAQDWNGDCGHSVGTPRWRRTLPNIGNWSRLWRSSGI